MSRFEGLMVGTPPPLCSSPMLEINGTRAPHPVASQADAYLFQVQISWLGFPRYSKILCGIIIIMTITRWNLAGRYSIARLSVTKGSGGGPTVDKPGRGLEVIIIINIVIIVIIIIILMMIRKIIPIKGETLKRKLQTIRLLFLTEQVFLTWPSWSSRSLWSSWSWWWWWWSERVFRHGCHLQAPVSGLQLREGHRLVPPGQVNTELSKWKPMTKTRTKTWTKTWTLSTGQRHRWRLDKDKDYWESAIDLKLI